LRHRYWRQLGPLRFPHDDDDDDHPYPVAESG
jgi:hypothetical protein